MVNGFILLIALEHLWFLILEMFLWQRPLGLKIFKMDEATAKVSAPLAKNQGLYNGFLAAGLVWGLVHPDPAIGLQIKLFFLICVALAGVYGSLTAAKVIFFIQSLPALVTLLLIFKNG